MRTQVRFLSNAVSWMLLVFILPRISFAQISLTMGSAYSEDFNSLSNSVSSNVYPLGWGTYEQGPFANHIYNLTNGLVIKADTYSMGATVSTDRALGGINGINVQPTVGAQFQNQTGAKLDEVTISYTGEQWSLGNATRGPDTLRFQFSTDATDLSSGTWNDISNLNFLSPIFGTVAGPLDGNDPLNQASLSFTLTSLKIADGGYLWIRWVDVAVNKKDDALGIDDLSLVVPSTLFYLDNDGDTYGDPLVSVVAFTQPTGYVADNTDCDDTNPAVNPGATEVCNGIDDNCDGQIDEGVQSTFYADNDGDSYGDPNNSTLACSAPSGYVPDNTDCDDTNGSVNPAAAEICNGIDDDCDGLIDNADPNVTGQGSWYADTDGDTYGDPNSLVLDCSQPSGYVLDDTDCDDTNSAVNPAATEVCNGTDDNCDGQIDEGVQSTFYADNDGDAYGDLNNTTLACSAPSGYVSDNTDCDDTNGAINPGATEICGDGIDNDCDGTTDPCGAPSNVSVSNLFSSFATVSWSGFSCADHYRVRHRPVGATDWIYVAIPDTFRKLVNMIPGTDYEVQVETFCDAGSDSSGYTSSVNFTTLNDCIAPTGLFISNVTSSSVTFGWTQPVSGNTFILRYRPTSGGFWTVTKHIPYATTSLDSGGLASGTDYEWQMKTKCNGSDASNWALGPNFTTAPRLGNFEGQAVAISIYPNPNNGQFIVEFASNDLASSIVVSDLTGRTLSVIPVSYEGTMHIPVNLQDEPVGIYFVTVNTNTQSQTFRIEVLK